MQQHTKNQHYPQNTPTTTNPTTTSPTDTTNSTTTSSTPQPMADLLTLQEQIKKDLVTNFSKLLSSKIVAVQQDFCHSFAELDAKFDAISNLVKMLGQQYHHLNQTLLALQDKLTKNLSPSNGEMGMHTWPFWTK